MAKPSGPECSLKRRYLIMDLFSLYKLPICYTFVVSFIKVTPPKKLCMLALWKTVIAPRFPLPDIVHLQWLVN